MKEWFCTKCYQVVQAKSRECCGLVEEFNLEEHGRLLIGSSNSWISVWNKWRSNSLLQEISSKCAEEGCTGAPTILNEFIEYLQDFYKGE